MDKTEARNESFAARTERYEAEQHYNGEADRVAEAKLSAESPGARQSPAEFRRNEVAPTWGREHVELGPDSSHNREARHLSHDEVASLRKEGVDYKLALRDKTDSGEGREAAEGGGGRGRDSLTPDEVASLRLQENARTEVEDNPEKLRVEKAVESLRKIDDLKPERWRELSPERRIVALRNAGRALRDSYDCPDPPIYLRELPEDDEKILCGLYSDGATVEHLDRDYNISLNEKFIHDDHPGRVLDTYCHEFRHAYQCEMATRYEKRLNGMVHNIDDAARWSDNIRRGYEDPNDDFSRYEEQVVEKDAREFSENVLKRLYG